MAGKKSAVKIMAVSSLILYTAASSDVSNPTNNRGSVQMRKLLSKPSSAPALNFAPHPERVEDFIKLKSVSGVVQLIALVLKTTP